MKLFKRKPKDPTLIDQLIDECMTDMLKMSSDSEDYSQSLNNLKDLYKLKETEKSHKRVSPDVVAGVSGNLLMTLMIMGHERTHAITTKAFGLIRPPKV